MPYYPSERLQQIQNKSARLVLRKSCNHHIHTPYSVVNMILKSSLDYCIGCQYKKRVDFKIACLVLKPLNNLSPSYIQYLIEIYKPTRAVRSSASMCLKTPIPPYSFVGRAFSFNASKIWNNLSHEDERLYIITSFLEMFENRVFKV